MLSVSYSVGKQIPPLAFLVGCGVLAVVGWVIDLLPWWIALAALITFGAVLVIGIFNCLRTRTSQTILRLDRSGVTVRGAATVAWSELTELVVRPLEPAWLVGSKSTLLICFMPVVGRALPGLPDLQGRPRPRGVRRAERAYGTALLVLPSVTTSSVEEISAAAQHFGGIRTRHVPLRRARYWLIIIGCGALTGVMVAVVRFTLGN